MKEADLEKLCQEIIDCKDGMELISIGTKINNKVRKSLDFRDFAMIQSLYISKGTELAMTDIFNSINMMQISMGMVEGDIPKRTDQH